MLLAECLVYLGLLVIVLNLAYGAYNRCADNSKRLNRNVDDVVRALQAGERWRDDVRAARNVIPSGDLLRLEKTNSMIDYLFYRGAIWRRTQTNASWDLFLPAVKSSRMEVDARREVTALSWSVELLTHGGSERYRPFFTFEAAPPAK